VTRHRILLGKDGAEVGRRQHGGLHFYGLCVDCNGLQSKYDGAYAELSDALRPLWDAVRQVELPGARFQTPQEECNQDANSGARALSRSQARRSAWSTRLGRVRSRFVSSPSTKRLGQSEAR
jgi:hypothetical protein